MNRLLIFGAKVINNINQSKSDKELATMVRRSFLKTFNDEKSKDKLPSICKD